MSENVKLISIGLDIGGSHATAAAFDFTTKRMIQSSITKVDINGHGESDNIIQNWADTILETIEKVGESNVEGIGFAMPGPFDYEKGIGLFELVGKFENLNGVNILHELKSKLKFSKDIPIRFINDASAFAIGEALVGMGKDYQNVMVVTLGTGFGSAFIKNGIPVVEGPEVPKQGCVWHLKYKEGIADDYFSTRWFVKEYEKITNIKASGVKEIAEAAEDNFNVNCLFECFGHNLAEFIAPHLKKFNAETLVLGGNISKAYHLFKGSFESELKKNEVETNINISELKEDAAIYGASLLLNNDLFQDIEPTLKHM